MRRLGARLAIGVAAVALGGSLATACTKDGGSEQEFCAALAKAPTLDAVIQGFTDADPGELDARFDDASDTFHELRDVAPKEVRSDMREVVSLVDAVIDAVRDHRDDPEAVTDAVRGAVTDHPGAVKATANVATYAADTCQLDLNPVVDGDDATSTTAPVTTTSAPG